MKPLNIAIVGGGGAGLAQAKYFGQIEGAKVTVIVDPHPELVKERLESRSLSNIKVTDAYEAVLKDSSIDVISVCTPDKTHADYVVQAFAAGKHVICEKPLGSTVEQCERMVHAWRRSGKVGGVQHQFRFEPWFSKAAQCSRSGKLGEIFSIRGEYVHNLIKRSTIHHGWRFDDKDSHPPMVGAGVHFLDLFRFLMKSDVTEISARANHISFPDYKDSDCVECTMAFDNGAIGSLTVAIGANHPIDFPIRIFGTKGSLVDGCFVTETSSERIEPPPPPQGLMYRLERAARQAYRELRGRPVRNCATRMWYDHVSACVGSLSNITDAIRKGGQPLVTMAEAARACEIATAATTAYREGKNITIPKSAW